MISLSNPITKTGNTIGLSYDSTLTLNGTQLSVASSASSQWTISGTNIYNNNSGSVGIGSQIPKEKLDVNGSINCSSNLIIGNNPATISISSYTVGTLTQISGTNESYLYYSTNGTLVLNENCLVDILIVGGGGAGGNSMGGGGGAGGVVYAINGVLNAGSYYVKVGTGGTGAAQVQLGTRGNNGNESAIMDSSQTTYISMNMGGTSQQLRGLGGGGGGSYYDAAQSTGGNGGSGGGASENNNEVVYTGGSATQPATLWNGSSYVSGGSAGNNSIVDVSLQYYAGGGGGAGGTNFNNNYRNGKTGISISITGSSVIYAAGGGGGSYGGSATTATGLGGDGIGGNGTVWNGSSTLRTATSGAANTGSGGGGLSYSQSGGTAGNGGSGVVIIRFKERKTFLNVKANFNDSDTGIIINANDTTNKNELRLHPYKNQITPSIALRGYSFKLFDSIQNINNDVFTIYGGGIGRVGINTKAPTTELDVIGTLKCNYFTAIDTNSGGVYCQVNNMDTSANAISQLSIMNNGSGGTITYYPTTHATKPNIFEIKNNISGGDLSLSTSSINSFIYIQNSSSFVGIGNTNPIQKLHIEDGSVFIGDSAYISPNGVATANGYKLIFDNSFNATAGTGEICNKIILHDTPYFRAGFGIEAGGVAYQSGGNHRFYINTTPSAYGTEAFTILNNGYIGINNNNPNTRLSVNHQGIIASFRTATDAYSSFIGFNNTTNSKTCYIGCDGVGFTDWERGALTMGTWTANSIIFATNAGEKIRITVNGQVGIGNGAPVDLGANYFNLHVGRCGAGAYNLGFLSIAQDFANGSVRQMRIGYDSSFNMCIGDWGATNANNTCTKIIVDYYGDTS